MIWSTCGFYRIVLRIFFQIFFTVNSNFAAMKKPLYWMSPLPMLPQLKWHFHLSQRPSSSQLHQLMSTSTHQGDEKVHTEDSRTEIKYKLLFNSCGMICSVLLIKKNCAVTAVTHPHYRPFILPFYAMRTKKVFRTKKIKSNYCWQPHLVLHVKWFTISPAVRRLY